MKKFDHLVPYNTLQMISELLVTLTYRVVMRCDVNHVMCVIFAVYKQ